MHGQLDAHIFGDGDHGFEEIFEIVPDALRLDGHSRNIGGLGKQIRVEAADPGTAALTCRVGRAHDADTRAPDHEVVAQRRHAGGAHLAQAFLEGLDARIPTFVAEHDLVDAQEPLQDRQRQAGVFDAALEADELVEITIRHAGDDVGGAELRREPQGLFGKGLQHETDPHDTHTP